MTFDNTVSLKNNVNIASNNNYTDISNDISKIEENNISKNGLLKQIDELNEHINKESKNNQDIMQKIK